jgi:hypothetical protein
MTTHLFQLTVLLNPAEIPRRAKQIACRNYDNSTSSKVCDDDGVDDEDDEDGTTVGVGYYGDSRDSSSGVIGKVPSNAERLLME